MLGYDKLWTEHERAQFAMPRNINIVQFQCNLNPSLCSYLHLRFPSRTRYSCFTSVLSTRPSPCSSSPSHLRPSSDPPLWPMSPMRRRQRRRATRKAAAAAPPACSRASSRPCCSRSWCGTWPGCTSTGSSSSLTRSGNCNSRTDLTEIWVTSARWPY